MYLVYVFALNTLQLIQILLLIGLLLPEHNQYKFAFHIEDFLN